MLLISPLEAIENLVKFHWSKIAGGWIKGSGISS